MSYYKISITSSGHRSVSVLSATAKFESERGTFLPTDRKIHVRKTLKKNFRVNPTKSLPCSHLTLQLHVHALFYKNQ